MSHSLTVSFGTTGGYGIQHYVRGQSGSSVPTGSHISPKLVGVSGLDGCCLFTPLIYEPCFDRKAHAGQ